MKLIHPSLHGHIARILAPLTLRPVTKTPALSGFTRFKSQNAGAWARAAITATCADTSTRWPRPVIERYASAVKAPMAASAPTHIGVCGTDTRIGSPPCSPARDIAPLSAMISRSEPLRSLYGPSRPNGEIETRISPGFRCCQDSYSIPTCSNTPGGKLSMMKSASSAKRKKRSRPLSLCKLRVIPRLFAL